MVSRRYYRDGHAAFRSRCLARALLGIDDAWLPNIAHPRRREVQSAVRVHPDGAQRPGQPPQPVLGAPVSARQVTNCSPIASC